MAVSARDDESVADVVRRVALERVAALRVADLMPLRLVTDDDAYSLRASLALRDDITRYSIQELLERYGDLPLLIVGDPGSGKTTVLADLVASSMTEGPAPVAFVPLGLHEPGMELTDLVTSGAVDRMGVVRAFERGGIRIVFDGANEVHGGDVDAFFADLFRLVASYPDNHYVISCRSSEVPPWVHEKLRSATLLPLAPEEVSLRFQQRIAALGPDSAAGRLLARRSFRLDEICTNPLLLSMTLALCDPSDPGGPEIEEISSRAAIYEQFLRRLEYRDLRKRPLPPDALFLSIGLWQEVLGFVGMRMEQTGRVSVQEEELQSWLATGLRNGTWDEWWPGGRPSVRALFRAVAGRPPLRAISSGVEEPLRYTFLHQSFGEFFAARQLKRDLEREDTSLRDVVAFLTADGRRHWEVAALLCGLFEQPERVTRALTKQAVERRDQRLLVLAGRCIADTWSVSVDEADDIRLRIIDAFKYWPIAFDYDLMRAAKEAASVQASRLPRRLVNDIDYFADKYAAVVPNELRETSTAVLCEHVAGGAEHVAIDAAYTLGSRGLEDPRDLDAATAALLKRLGTSAGLLREQLVAALKELKPLSALDRLVAIAEDPAETPRTRGFALNAIGSAGDLAHCATIERYLLNRENPYRDSASWSLQALARRAAESAPELLPGLKATYIKALRSETDDESGSYARGNILYSLGVLGAIEYRDEILRWLETQQDAYVLEDGIHAIGLLGGEHALGFVARFCSSDDPAQRLKAAEAVGRLADARGASVLGALLDDRYALVREAAARALETVTAAPDEPAKQLIKALRAPLRKLVDEVAVKVTSVTRPVLEVLVGELYAAGTITSRPHFADASSDSWDAQMTPATHAALLDACARLQDGPRS